MGRSSETGKRTLKLLPVSDAKRSESAGESVSWGPLSSEAREMKWFRLPV